MSRIHNQREKSRVQARQDKQQKREPRVGSKPVMPLSEFNQWVENFMEKRHVDRQAATRLAGELYDWRWNPEKTKREKESKV